MQPEDVINHYEEKVSGATAQDVLRDEVSTMNRIANATAVKRLLPQIHLFYNFVKDCACGRYSDYSKDTLKLIVGGLAYLALPGDIVPDFIPAVGWLDDVVVLEWIFQRVGQDLTMYKESILHRKNRIVSGIAENK